MNAGTFLIKRRDIERRDIFPGNVGPMLAEDIARESIIRRSKNPIDCPDAKPLATTRIPVREAGVYWHYGGPIVETYTPKHDGSMVLTGSSGTHYAERHEQFSNGWNFCAAATEYWQD